MKTEEKQKMTAVKFAVLTAWATLVLLFVGTLGTVASAGTDHADEAIIWWGFVGMCILVVGLVIVTLVTWNNEWENRNR